MTKTKTIRDRHVATLNEVAEYWGVPYGTIERLSKGRTSAGHLRKAKQGWPLDEAARLLLAKPSRNDPTAKAEAAEKITAARAAREEARSLLEQFRAAKEAGKLVDAEKAKALRLSIISGYNAILEAMPDEAAAKAGLVGDARDSFARDMTDWQARQRTAMGRSLQ